mmetsp:Transcript_30332/g.48846  ORF Transcript_30332/g.48846 Transcript_30332/m.48846 type:complete len:204 (-) Transcript_30332:3108-3719(-)
MPFASDAVWGSSSASIDSTAESQVLTRRRGNDNDTAATNGTSALDLFAQLLAGSVCSCSIPRSEVNIYDKRCNNARRMTAADTPRLTPPHTSACTPLCSLASRLSSIVRHACSKLAIITIHAEANTYPCFSTASCTAGLQPVSCKVPAWFVCFPRDVRPSSMPPYKTRALNSARSTYAMSTRSAWSSAATLSTGSLSPRGMLR